MKYNFSIESFFPFLKHPSLKFNSFTIIPIEAFSLSCGHSTYLHKFRFNYFSAYVSKQMWIDAYILDPFCCSLFPISLRLFTLLIFNYASGLGLQ